MIYAILAVITAFFIGMYFPKLKKYKIKIEKKESNEEEKNKEIEEKKRIEAINKSFNELMDYSYEKAVKGGK